MCDHSGKFMLANQSFKVLKDYSPIHEKKTEGKSFTKVESLYTYFLLSHCKEVPFLGMYLSYKAEQT